jgi:transposase
MNAPSSLRLSKSHRAAVVKQQENCFFEYVLAMPHCPDARAFGRSVAVAVPPGCLVRYICQQDLNTQTWTARLWVKGMHDFKCINAQVVSVKKLKKPADAMPRSTV